MTRPSGRGEWERAKESEHGNLQGDNRPSRESFSKVTMGFDSGDERCSGWLYRPDRPAEPPVVVMAGGLAGDRSFGLPNYAERLAEAGYAVFLFDYRNHGDSGGDPRNLVSPSRQRADWEAAIEGVRTRDGLDTSNLVLWGTDLGGGHVLDVAADDPRVRAVVSQTPIRSGRAFLTTRGYGFLAKTVFSGIRDRLQSFAVGPYTVPIAGNPEEFALVSTPGARRGYLDTVPSDAQWTNETPARSLLNLARFSAGSDLDSVTCPVLLFGGTRDDVVPIESVADAADEISDATFVSLPVGHFDTYEGSGLDHVIGHAVAFLDAELDN
ncbi:lysophospholipase [Halogeometricum borinquense DSM 11551]|uniref:Lysophospholipase n=1 Tax=Halogeometricum borinquense (strain ATCC 700274 / DSM 11551 / JCM 10706 / KCTC 4070 / PR3) TaxID=469382 RepID=L9V170_HALBP|nr:alpha/beta hydrolase [Halogeometricum borinquense]ELY30756.1 lysophospholipase [Halogeometricum borinquense DSM 11551]